MKILSAETIKSLEHSWTAKVKLKNKLEIIIWYTCWPSIQHIVSKIIWIASDYPKHKITRN